MKRTLKMAAIILLIVAGYQAVMAQPDASKSVIGPKEMKLSSNRLNAEVLWAMGRLGEVVVSPEGNSLALTITYYDVAENKGNSELYTMKTDGSDFKRLTFTSWGEYNPRWTPDGKKIAFMSAESGSMQLWEMKPDGSNKLQISMVDGGIGGFAFAPDQQKVLYLADVEKPSIVQSRYPDLPKTSGRINNDLMYRHWDQWVDAYTHIWVANYDGKQLSNSKDIMAGEEWESPVRPFGGMEQITWSSDSKSVVYTCRKKKGKEYSLSTNTDLYRFNLETGETTNLTEGMMGYDMNPVFSPDGQKIAWESMERDGYEADKIRLFVMDLKSGNKQYLTEKFDQNAQGLSWSADSKKIYFISNWHALDQMYSIELASGKVHKITEGVHDFTSVMVAGKFLVGARMSMSSPSELFRVEETAGKQLQISNINTALLNQLEFGKVEERWVATTDGKQMLVWVIYPPHFDANKKYPALLYCQGGPQSTVSQFWSYRWNFQMMAANDYIIVAPNRRGLPGFGQEWLEQISGDYGGQNMKDYFSAIDAVSKEPFIDTNRLGAVGASYGGFSVYWMAGNHNKRFKAFIAHDGMFNLEQQFLETEENWFTNWDLGGPFWDKTNKVALWSYENSPHKFVQNWDTPILVIHGERDYRIVASQGMAAYNAAVLRGIPAEYLYFPDENHWVLKPQNGVLWQRTFFNWLDKWLK